MSRFALATSLALVTLVASPAAANALSGPPAGGTGASPAALQYRDGGGSGSGNGNGNGNGNNGSGGGDVVGAASCNVQRFEPSPLRALQLFDERGCPIPGSPAPGDGGVAGERSSAEPVAGDPGSALAGGSDGIETRVAAARDRSELPFTGASLSAILVAGLVLLVGGAVFRRRPAPASARATATS